MKKTKDCKIQDKRRLYVVVKGGDRVCPDNKIILFQREKHPFIVGRRIEGYVFYSLHKNSLCYMKGQKIFVLLKKHRLKNYYIFLCFTPR